MIKVKLKELMAKKSYEGERITLKDLAEVTGISRTTLHRIANIPGYSTTTDHLDRICKALNCSLDDLAEFVPSID